MFILNAQIQIGQLLFTEVTEVVLKKSVDMLSDTAVIKLPTTFVLVNGEETTTQETERVVHVGDAVSITLGYEGVQEKEEFNGYVVKVRPNTPIEIHCEDALYLLRRQTFNKNFVDSTLEDILRFIAGDILPIAGAIPTINYKKFLLKNINGAQALGKLKKDFGLSIYINNEGALFAGLRQQEGAGDRVIYNLEGNIVRNDLTYREEEQRRIKLIVRGWKQDNTYNEVEVGDSDGEQRIWFTYEIQDPAALKELGESILQDFKYAGYEGTLTSWGVPFADRGMTATVVDELYPERNGDYFIPEVTMRYGVRGFRRVVKLGRKV